MATESNQSASRRAARLLRALHRHVCSVTVSDAGDAAHRTEYMMAPTAIIMDIEKLLRDVAKP